MKSCIHLKLSSLVYNVMEFKVYIFLYVDLEVFAVLIGESGWEYNNANGTWHYKNAWYHIIVIKYHRQ